MMNRKAYLQLATVAVVLTVGISGASAALTVGPLPDTAYITVGDLDWAWASPVNVQFFSNNELMPPEFQEGWRFATDAEMAGLPSLADFTRPDASYIQASEYWNTVYTHVDPGDFAAGYVSSQWGHGTYDTEETVYVRDVSVIPAPGALALVGAGLLSLVARRRKFSQA
jgi:uncharacterized protein (TIGR03382 family)